MGVAPMAAVRSRDIAYLIIVNGPGRDALSQGAYPLVQLLRKSGIGEAEAEKAYDTMRRVVAILRANGTAEEAMAAGNGLEKYPALRADYRVDETGIHTLQALLKDPVWSLEADQFLRHVDQPTLAIFGKRDALVDWRESIGVYQSAFRDSGNRDLTVKVFDDADHEMQPSPEKRSDSTKFVRGYLTTVISWLEARGFTEVRR